MNDARMAGSEPSGALQRLHAQLLGHWRQPPAALCDALDAILAEALQRAAATEAEVLTVMNPTSRPQRLRLAVVADDAALDSFYHNQWAEFAISDQGRAYLLYRRRDGGDYAVEWSTATSVPGGLMARLPDALAEVMFESDDDAGI